MSDKTKDFFTGHESILEREVARLREADERWGRNHQLVIEERAAALRRVKELEGMLSNLLARIHRDGGHYEAEHGTAKAVADADDIVARIYAEEAPIAALSGAGAEKVERACPQCDFGIGLHEPGCLASSRARQEAKDVEPVAHVRAADLAHLGRNKGIQTHLYAEGGKHLTALYAAPIPTQQGWAPFGDAAKFTFGQRLTKTKGSSWTGKVVGFYSTSLTPIGYCIESENEPGSVQLYPEGALEAANG